MTSKEALDKIKHIDIDGRYPYPNFLKDDVRYKESIEVIEKRLNELEKRDTPMKPLIDKLDLWAEHKCPVCESTVWEVHVHKDENFCSNCGQRLDWEEENDYRNV